MEPLEIEGQADQAPLAGCGICISGAIRSDGGNGTSSRNCPGGAGNGGAGSDLYLEARATVGH